MNIVRMTLNKIKMMAVVTLVFILIISIFLVVGPIFTGLQIYNKASNANKSIDDYIKGVDTIKNELKIELGTLEINMSACYGSVNALSTQLDSCNRNLMACIRDSEKQTFMAQSCKEDVEKLRVSTSSEIENLKTQLNKKIEEQDLLTSNVAKNTCCKAKIDNPNVNFYKVENNKIVCSDESGISLNCTM